MLGSYAKLWHQLSSFIMDNIQQDPDVNKTSFSKSIQRALLRDIRLSFAARGLFAMLWDYPNNWIFNISHIEKMSPSGIFQLNQYLKELKNIGAISITPKKLTVNEASELSKRGLKQFKAGQINGWEWKLNHPDLWAIEAPLSSQKKSEKTFVPKYQFPDTQEIRQSEIPTNEEIVTKVFELEGSANIQPQQQVDSSISVDKESCGGNSYIFPKPLSPEEIISANLYLKSIDPVLGQQLLDELAGRINSKSIRTSTLGYLRSLVAQAQRGSFIPELGIRVAQARERTKAIQEVPEITPTAAKDVPARLAAMHKVLGRKDR